MCPPDSRVCRLDHVDAISDVLCSALEAAAPRECSVTYSFKDPEREAEPPTPEKDEKEHASALERAASLRREVSTSTNRQDQLQLSLSEELSGLAIDPPEDKTFFCNRSICLEQMLRDKGWTQVKGPVKNGALTKNPATGKPVSAVFAYWDVFGDVPHVPSSVNNWPRACTNCLDCLYTMFVRLYATCKARDVVPDTVIGPAWRALTREEFETCPVWFIKDVFGRMQKGITCVNTFEDYQRFASTMPKEG
jgi:hypothetical protein